MNVPAKAFYSVREISARWGYSEADVAGWAAVGHLTLVTSVAVVTCGAQPVDGIVEVSAGDMLCMFRRHGPSEAECRVARVRRLGQAEWQYITGLPGGLVIKLTDLLLVADAAHVFEEERHLFGRPAVSKGALPRYDWDGVNIMLFQRFHDHGLPATQADLIDEVQNWFALNSATGDIPEESTTRKKIAPIWWALRGRK